MNQRFVKRLLYGSLDEESFNGIIPDIVKNNGENLFVYSAISTVLFILISIASALGNSIANVNRPLYFGCTAFSLIICLASKIKNDEALTRILTYAFQFLLYGFSLALLTRHPDLPSVSAIVMLVVIPLLFTDRPINIVIITSAVVFIFCVMAFYVKDKSMAINDIWNAITFGLVGICVGIFVDTLRIRAIVQNQKILMLSEVDLLTGLLNRNCFEQRIYDYPAKAEKVITCIYADVNGLHELNNEKGHKQGDMMLQSVAQLFMHQFGKNDSYRIGGDEFVAFILDTPIDTVNYDVQMVNRSISALGYHVSFGTASISSGDGNMDELLKAAEDDMYRVKAAYYRNNGLDRRSHNYVEK